MSEPKLSNGTAPTAIMAEAAVACMRANAELQSRLANGWLDLLTHGMAPPSAVVAWGMEAMRLTAETTLRNIEHCQHCANQAAAAPK